VDKALLELLRWIVIEASKQDGEYCREVLLNSRPANISAAEHTSRGVVSMTYGSHEITIASRISKE
jgi:hypothetical protein